MFMCTGTMIWQRNCVRGREREGDLQGGLTIHILTTPVKNVLYQSGDPKTIEVHFKVRQGEQEHKC